MGDDDSARRELASVLGGGGEPDVSPAELARVGLASAALPTIERRRVPRHACRLPAVLRIAGEELRCRAIDVSLTGCRLALDEDRRILMTVAARGELVLMASDGKSRPILCEVVASGRHGRLHLEFLDELAPETLARFIAGQG